ncbi:MAG TPA: PQQ-binding-like beta-propeller repeat protein, partial [Planctomycetota bacterium]|nr:PQQ-binding-like beta-propeller repeat protein [Planctomycetota bacterium]
VIPSAFGPIQALLVVLPQLLLALGAAMVALLKPKTYRFLAAYLWAHKGLACLLVALGASAVWGAGALFRAGVTAETGGGSWTAFRGGPARTGTREGDDGPRRSPRVAWQVGADILGRGARIDASPAVVGNRVYAAAGVPAVLGPGRGAIHAFDLETGGRAWSWTGTELNPPLRPVFSSPAVDADAQGARWLVSGEGYHEDKDCRIAVLDLAPVRAGGAPTLHAWVQTTSHVESSPCVHGGIAYVGAGDDGLYAVDLAAGRVAWRLEGDAFYEIAPGGPDLAPFVGKTVAAVGRAKRVFTGETPDANHSVLTIGAVKPHEGALSPAPGGPSPDERVVLGKVSRTPKGFRIETGLHLPDCESSPVVLPGPAPTLFFGSGIGGQAVCAVDARSGAVRWKTPVPHPAFGAPTVVDGKVLIGLGNGTFIRSDPKPAGAVVCLALDDGRELWRAPTGDSVLGAVASHGGRAFAGSRDGHLYAFDLKTGAVAQKVAVGAPVVCSPAVTASSVYVTTDGGKLLGFDRETLRLRWSHVLAPDAQVISSPSVAGGRLVVGTPNQGLVALADAPAGDGPAIAQAWSGPGGTADRRGIGDDRGAPRLSTDAEGNVDVRGPLPPPLRRAVLGPLAGSGDRVFAVFAGPRLAAVDASTMAVAWEVDTPPVAALAADAARVYVLAGGELRALDRKAGSRTWGPVKADGPFAVLDGSILYASHAKELLALDAATGTVAWTAPLGDAVAAPAAGHDLVVCPLKDSLLVLSAERGRRLYAVDVPCAAAPALVETGRELRAVVAGPRSVRAVKLADGSTAWKAELDEPVIGHPVASEAYVAVPTREKVVVFRTGDGRELQSLPVGTSPVPPILSRDLLIMGAEQRVAAFDLGAGEWPWNYKDQDHVGKVSAAPVALNEMIWVGTTARGLLVFGARTAP